MFFGKRKPKRLCTKELIRALLEHLNVDKICRNESHAEQMSRSNEANGSDDSEVSLSEEGDDGIAKYLSDTLERVQHQAEGEREEQRKICLISNLCKFDVPFKILENLADLDFESRKVGASLFTELLVSQQNGSSEATIVEKYMRQKSTDVVRSLTRNFAHPELSLICGPLLRECLKYGYMYLEVFSDNLYVIKELLHKHLQTSSFDVACDGFQTLQEILTKNTEAVAAILDSNCDEFTIAMNSLLLSNYYVSQRHCLMLLHRLLCERLNYSFMIKYINKKKHLVLIMNLMRSESPIIREEAFRIFSIFLANPDKSSEVIEILLRNKEKLIVYINQAFFSQCDENFEREKEEVLLSVFKLSGAARRQPGSTLVVSS